MFTHFFTDVSFLLCYFQASRVEWKQRFLLFCQKVRKSIKASFCLTKRAFCEENLNLRSIPFRLFTEMNWKENEQKKTKFDFNFEFSSRPIISKNYYSPHFLTLVAYFRLQFRDLFGNEVSRIRNDSQRDEFLQAFYLTLVFRCNIKVENLPDKESKERHFIK